MQSQSTDIERPEAGACHLYMLAHASKPAVKIGIAYDVFQRCATIPHEIRFDISLAAKGTRDACHRAEGVLHRLLDPHRVDAIDGSGATEWFSAQCLEKAMQLFELLRKEIGMGPLEPCPLPANRIALDDERKRRSAERKATLATRAIAREKRVATVEETHRQVNRQSLSAVIAFVEAAGEQLTLGIAKEHGRGRVCRCPNTPALLDLADAAYRKCVFWYGESGWFVVFGAQTITPDWIEMVFCEADYPVAGTVLKQDVIDALHAAFPGPWPSLPE